uniref:mRNA export factor GLE1 n=1 Tax=Davidia involucrata TaxID=16924 RepID=A0A5B6YNB3_DAVIN
MGAVKLELRLSSSIDGIAVDPQPDWSFDTLLLELSSIEKKLNASSEFPLPFTKTKSREFFAAKNMERSPGAFVMHVSEDEMEDIESDGDEEAHDRRVVGGRRFACDELYLSGSDDSEDELALGTQHHLMDKVGIVEGALSELTHEHQLNVTEEIRFQILALETDLMNENEKFTSALAQVEKYTEARREMDRKLDMQYQRRIAEALDNHLTAVQRDHEHRSQIEERRIRDDAAFEEAKRKEKALHEEKLRQEKIKAEARLEAEKKRAEEAKAAALEADRRAAKEAAEKFAAETSRRAGAAVVPPKEAAGHQMGASFGILNDQSKGSGSDGLKKAPSAGNILKGAESALELEDKRLQIYKEIAVQNEALGLGSNKEYRSYGMQIARRIKTISGSKENVRAKASELINIFLNSTCPQSICIAMFAELVVTQCVNFTKSLFAYGHVIALVTSQVPLAMDLLLAELNRVCIYTVPKYINYSKSVFETQEAYNKAIGYREEDGKIESTDSYIARLESYMKLYGAIVQTEVEGVQNVHGLKEGWAWFARFLNALPANLYTAVALQAFLEMTGFALFKRYKTQFKKLLNIIYRDFLNALKERGEDTKLNKVIYSIQTYIESKQFLEEPEGWRLKGSLLSHTFVPESDYQEQYHRPPNRFF